MSAPKYPDIKVRLVGRDGNAFVVLGAVSAALRMADVPADQVKAFTDEATSGDYSHLLRTAMAWVDVS